MTLHFCYNTHSNDKDLVESFDPSSKGIKWKRLFALFHKNEIISRVVLVILFLQSNSFFIKAFRIRRCKKRNGSFSAVLIGS